jgi:5-(carboxyamino)imidazole ribonucleotide synthase
VIAAAFDDAEAAARLAEHCEVVSYEIERVGEAPLIAVAARTRLRPSASVLLTVQDRATQKRWLRDRLFPVADYRSAADPDEVARALQALGGPCRLKARRGGYDGRGQARAAAVGEAGAAIAEIGSQPCVVERELALEAELSILVARRPSGDIALHPVSRNWHEGGVLDLAQIPAELPKSLEARAVDLGIGIAEKLGVEGILAVELFVADGGQLFVNELSPRPHNTFHTADVACATSRFEQYVRAIWDLPLGATQVVRPAALANLMGDLWGRPRSPRFERALALDGVKLVLYDKQPHPGRKLGHLLASAPTAREAVARVGEARRRL